MSKGARRKGVEPTSKTGKKTRGKSGGELLKARALGEIKNP